MIALTIFAVHKIFACMALMRAVGARPRSRGDLLPISYLIDMSMTCCIGPSWHEACKASGEYRCQR
jgi:hypothetical protein